MKYLLHNSSSYYYSSPLLTFYNIFITITACSSSYTWPDSLPAFYHVDFLRPF